MLLGPEWKPPKPRNSDIVPCSCRQDDVLQSRSGSRSVYQRYEVTYRRTLFEGQNRIREHNESIQDTDPGKHHASLRLPGSIYTPNINRS